MFDITRKAFVLTALLSSGCSGVDINDWPWHGGGPAEPPGTGSPGQPKPPASDERLVVADADAQRLYVFDVNDWRQLTDIPDIQMADHPGFLPLSDGRLLFVDTLGNRLIIMRVNGVPTPFIERSIPVLGQAAHLAVDPDGTNAVVSASSAYEDGRGALTIASLESERFEHVPLSTSEPGIAVLSDPLRVVHRNDAPPAFEMYALQDLQAQLAEPIDVVPLGPAPHGEVVAHARDTIASAAANGINVVAFDAEGFGEQTVVPYTVGDADYGRAFYARLSGDGRFLYSYLRDDAGGATTWENWRNDVYIVDLETQLAKRIPVGAGLVYRLGTCERLAAFTQYAPEGDSLHLLDADIASPTFQTITASVPLERLSLAPAAGEDVWASDAFRITALSSDCKYGFVTHGGNGKVSVVDTASSRVVRLLELPTPLVAGGYLVSMRSGQPLVDTIGR